MKKILITIFMLLIVPMSAGAKMSTTETISSIENNMFGYDYSKESETKRLERIEMQLYGIKREGTPQKRLEDIKNDIGYVEADEIASPAPIPSNQQRQFDKQKGQVPDDITALKEDSTVEYPMVDKMEQQIFSTTYKNENIYNRLNRLEEKVFNKTSSESLNARVDRLASVVRPVKNKNNRNQDTFADNPYNNYNNYSNNSYDNMGIEPVNSQSLPFQLAALEQDLLKHDYMNENVSNRLSRLEQKLFNRTFATDSDITRMQRVMVAYDAKKDSYRYENNRKMQNMATMSQLGGILLMILAILL
ncbi:MAG: hypothetical protein LUG16_01235 [Candidatus Gastranaerophilales bacterium]|nr:hypothetical protein [Candidatus Gastranaerophilales bacterium]